jgi:hypothetical protein
VDSDGEFRVAVSGLKSGDVVRAVQTLNGLVSEASPPIIVRSPTPAPVLTPPPVEESTSVNGAGIPGATINIFVNGKVVATGLAGPAGSFSIAIPAT